jgi:hypothetical protein
MGQRRIYFDTSAWNSLAKHPGRNQLVGTLKGALVFASVFSVRVLQKAHTS